MRVWSLDPPQAEPLILRGHADSVLSVAFSPDGGRLASAGSDSTVRVWRTIDKMFTFACRRAGRNLSWDEWQNYFGNAPYAKTCEELPVHFSVIDHAVTEATGGNIDSAKTLFQRVSELDPDRLNATNWNELCWNGGLWNFAKEVISACERAVKLSEGKDGGIRDSRGLIRALTGDFPGAIEDFEKYIEWGPSHDQSEQTIQQRREWIKVLQEDRNPIDEETLRQLK